MKNNYPLSRRRTRATRRASHHTGPARQTEQQAIAEAIPSLFVLIQSDGTFLRKKHHVYGHLAVVFTSKAVAGQYLSGKSRAYRAQLRLTQLRPTCFEQITSWCKAGKCSGCWMVDAHNVTHDYPCDSIVTWAVPDPETGQFIVKGGAA